VPEKKSKKVGRPKLAKGEAREPIIQFRVQPSEKTAYQKAATARGVDVSSWIRQTLNAAIKA
jgi:predicted HicB family RNase H-like nuclease